MNPSSEKPNPKVVALRAAHIIAALTKVVGARHVRIVMEDESIRTAIAESQSPDRDTLERTIEVKESAESELAECISGIETTQIELEKAKDVRKNVNRKYVRKAKKRKEPSFREMHGHLWSRAVHAHRHDTSPENIKQLKLKKLNNKLV